MSARPGIQVTATHPANGGESPNRFDPYVTVHIRAYWPPLATDEEIEGAFWDAVGQAKAAIVERRGRTPRGWTLEGHEE